MRVLILAPWFRNLAHVHASALSSAGMASLVVTTGSQPYPVDRSTREVVLAAGLRGRGVVRGFLRAALDVWRFRADAVVLDDCWDPRFAVLARFCKRRLVLVHDASPHDDVHRDNWWKRPVRAAVRRSATHLGAFSRHVGHQLRAQGKPVEHLALPTEFSELQPQGDLAGPRSGFLFLGRLSPYKGLGFLLRSWTKAVDRLPAGERLYVLASGVGTISSAPGLVARQGTYDEAQVKELLGTVRAVVLPYSEASQSGVQVLAMQFGVPTVVTAVGALAEMQPPGAPIVAYGDEEALAQALLGLCVPGVHERLSTSARQAYLDHHSEAVIATRLTHALGRLVS